MWSRRDRPPAGGSGGRPPALPRARPRHPVTLPTAETFVSTWSAFAEPRLNTDRVEGVGAGVLPTRYDVGEGGRDVATGSTAGAVPQHGVATGRDRPRR